MGISAKELRKSLSPDVAALSAQVLAELDRPTIAPAELAAAQAMGVKGITVAPTEHEEQVALFQWAAANEGEHEELKLLFAVPNGGYRPMTTAAQLKAEGVRSGVPDCCLPVARGRFHSLWIEMKRKPNRPTEAQEHWISTLRDYGHSAVVCYGAQEAIDVIKAYLGIE